MGTTIRGSVMVDNSILRPLTGYRDFDELIANFANIADPEEQEAARSKIWDKYGVHGAVFISDMASFSSTSRRVGVCHFLKLIHRARQIIAPIVAANNGTLLKCDADNCYAFFERTDDAIQTSFDVNGALFKSNENYGMEEQIFARDQAGDRQLEIRDPGESGTHDCTYLRDRDSVRSNSNDRDETT